MSFRQFSKLSALIGVTNAAGGNYVYTNGNGNDWAGIADADLPDADGNPQVNQCGESNQSPINLFFEGQDGFNYDIKEAIDDLDLTGTYKDYSNQFNAKVNWAGDTTKINLVSDQADGVAKSNDHQELNNYFESNMLKDAFGANGKKFRGIQFHQHTQSEHTINGVRYDLEMHTVHYPEVGTANYANDQGQEFIAAAMGIIFDTNPEKVTAKLSDAEVAVIDIFFDTMKWTDKTTDEPTVDYNAYGSLMEMVDFRNRWVYKGSVTTPPCARFVYWNVISTIYPIKQRHLDAFKALLDEKVSGLGSTTGNWRKINDINGHDVIYVKNGVKSQLAELKDLAANPEKAKGLVAATVIFALIAFFALIGCAIFGYQAHSKEEVVAKAEEAVQQEVEMGAPDNEAKGAEE